MGARETEDRAHEEDRQSYAQGDRAEAGGGRETAERLTETPLGESAEPERGCRDGEENGARGAGERARSEAGRWWSGPTGPSGKATPDPEAEKAASEGPALPGRSAAQGWGQRAAERVTAREPRGAAERERLGAGGGRERGRRGALGPRTPAL